MRRIYWEITNMCNLRCKHCYLYDELVSPSSPPSNELDTQQCICVVDQIEEMNTFHLIVQGGEPFARPDIIEILSYMGEKKFWTQVDTNATLIDENIARDLTETGIKHLFVSLEGPNAEINDAVRGMRSFERAIRGIGYLRDFGIPFYTQMTVNKLNYTAIEDIADFSLGIGAKGVAFVIYVDIPSEKRSSSLIDPSKEEAVAASKKMHKIKEKYPKGFIAHDESFDFACLDPESKIGVDDTRFVRCGLGSWTINICNNGDVLPCPLMRDKRLGNVIETPLPEIIETSPEFEAFKNLRKITVEDANEECKACEWKYVCGGGCKGRAYLRYGSVFAPDPHRCLMVRDKIPDNPIVRT